MTEILKENDIYSKCTEGYTVHEFDMGYELPCFSCKNIGECRGPDQFSSLEYE